MATPYMTSSNVNVEGEDDKKDEEETKLVTDASVESIDTVSAMALTSVTQYVDEDVEEVISTDVPMSSSNEGSSTVAYASVTTNSDRDIISDEKKDIETVHAAYESLIPSSDLSSTMASPSMIPDVNVDGNNAEHEKEEAKLVTYASVEALETASVVASQSVTQVAHEDVKQVMTPYVLMGLSEHELSTLASPLVTTNDASEIIFDGIEKIEAVQATDEQLIPSSAISSTMESPSILSDLDVENKDDNNEKEET
ncbi:hypothetical protein ACJMK2_026902 [Sinanodonta woodiana]|uniref:Uncharacterized protein n=1 Tax=Sinanodonta woodiana TaxID=1069815 RepID=A0ABD3XMV6_SINWO